MRTPTHGIIVLILALGSLAAAQVQPLAGLDDYISQAMTTFQVPGLAVAIVKDGKVLLAKGYGVRKIGEPARVDEHTLFGIASNTKAEGDRTVCAVGNHNGSSRHAGRRRQDPMGRSGRRATAGFPDVRSLRDS